LVEVDYRGLIAVELPRHSHAAPEVARRSLEFLRECRDTSGRARQMPDEDPAGQRRSCWIAWPTMTTPLDPRWQPPQPSGWVSRQSVTETLRMTPLGRAI
jgi:hypothetical protein